MLAVVTFHSWSRDVDFEIIVVDDGGPDGTQEVVKQLQKLYGEDHMVSSMLIYLQNWIYT